MSQQTINININLNGLQGELQASLQKVICLVATGLKAECEVEPNELSLPTNVVTTFGNYGIGKEEFGGAYREWVISNGFRDAIESVNVFLESAHQVLAIWNIVQKQNNGE